MRATGANNSQQKFGKKIALRKPQNPLLPVYNLLISTIYSKMVIYYKWVVFSQNRLGAKTLIFGVLGPLASKGSRPPTTSPRPPIDSSHLGKQHTLFSFFSRFGRSQLDERGISSVRLLKALIGEKKDSLELQIEKMTPYFRVATQKTLKFGEVYILAWWFLNIFIFFQVPCWSQFLRLTTHTTHTACRTPESLETCQLSLHYHRK